MDNLPTLPVLDWQVPDTVKYAPSVLIPILFTEGVPAVMTKHSWLFLPNLPLKRNAQIEPRCHPEEAMEIGNGFDRTAGV